MTKQAKPGKSGGGRLSIDKERKGRFVGDVPEKMKRTAHDPSFHLFRNVPRLGPLSPPSKLPKGVGAKLRDQHNQVFASAASTWELAIKAALGKVEVDIEELIRAVDDTGFRELPVTMRHTTRVRELPHHHRDPFDRILIAQSREEQLTLVTRDPAFRRYCVTTSRRSGTENRRCTPIQSRDDPPRRDAVPI